MNRRFISLISPISLLITACAAKAPAPAPQPPAPVTVQVPDSVIWNGDEDLAPILRKPELNDYVMGGVDRVEMRLGNSEFADRLSYVAEDSTAPWLVRVNALKLLANRGVVEHIPVFVEALDANDERVRITAVTSMREFMAVRQDAALDILKQALNNSSTRVQTAALQVMADRDVTVLRDFLARTTNSEIRTVTIDLIRAAEERGAALLAKDTLGTLERTTSHNMTLTFKPTERWKKWDAAVGDVFVTLPKKKPVLVASGVEVVGSVVPAFFTSDGNSLVYELNRAVHVRDLATSVDRKLADGIAPRILPFTNDVIYLREVRGKRSETPNSFGLKYDVLRQPTVGTDTAKVVGQIGASALNNQKGNYATVRWMRVREDEGAFYLIGDMIEPFKLPNPFGD